MELLKQTIKLNRDYSKFKKGETVPLTKILKDNETWEAKGNPIIKHGAVERIKDLVGLEVDMPLKCEVWPSLENNMSCIWVGNMRLPEQESGANKEIVIGEANNKTTPIGYNVTVAQKRWYDRAVLQCLKLEGWYSSMESEQFEDADAKKATLSDLSGAEQKSVKEFVKRFAEAKDIEELKAHKVQAAEQIKAGKMKLTDKAKSVLNSIFDTRKKELSGDTNEEI